MWALKNSFQVSISKYTLFLTEGRLVSSLFCTPYQDASPSEVYFLWLYQKDGVPTRDQFSPRLERDGVVRVTTGVSVW